MKRIVGCTTLNYQLVLQKLVLLNLGFVLQTGKSIHVMQALMYILSLRFVFDCLNFL